jgi:glyoxylase-like metal-dependent hydrolase (beta-lactamase superfamily II)
MNDVSIQGLITAEIESGITTILLNGGDHIKVPKDELMPKGYNKEIKRFDGSISEGILIPVPVWLLRSSGKNILVDTGIGSFDDMKSTWGGKDKTTGIPLFNKPKEWELQESLLKVGLKPENIDIVIHTHLHWDHVGNDVLFNKALFLVHENEIPLAINNPNWAFFYSREYPKLFCEMQDRVQILRGDYQLTAEIEIVYVGGHTPGGMAVIVSTKKGKIALAGDLVFSYKNLEHNLPIGAYWRLDEVIDSVNMLKRRADIIIPGHDWGVWDNFPGGVII